MHRCFLFFEIHELHIFRSLRNFLSADVKQRGFHVGNYLFASFAFFVSGFKRFLDVTDFFVQSVHFGVLPLNTRFLLKGAGFDGCCQCLIKVPVGFRLKRFIADFIKSPRSYGHVTR